MVLFHMESFTFIVFILSTFFSQFFIILLYFYKTFLKPYFIFLALMLEVIISRIE